MSGSFDEIIFNRRTVRAFTEVRPGEEMVRAVIRAGLHAPFAALAVPENAVSRRFVVIDGRSQALQRLRALLRKRADFLYRLVPLLNLFRRRKIGPAFRQRLRADPLGDAPWYIFVVEPKGFPPTARQSMAHCLQNMWLKATELGLGFRLVSMIESLDGDRELCRLLGIERGRYAFNACAIGHPLQPGEPSRRDDPDLVTTWIRA